MELTTNGITLSYDFEGEGKLSFLLIHGVGANRTFFSGIYQHLLQYGRVLNADLRGHGKSEKPEQPYLIETYAQDLKGLCQELKLDNIIVIGHSMGGNIAIEFAACNPELVKGLVLLDTWLFFSESATAFFTERLRELQSPQYQAHLENLVKMRCLPTDRHKDLVRSSFLETPQLVWCSSLENMKNWDTAHAEERIKSCAVPVLYIYTHQLLIDLEKFQQLYPSQVILGKVIGSGHFCNLEVPDQLNPMLNRFISTYLA
jgi:pimeloyl-ACP methyl ester carboxylesterase